MAAEQTGESVAGAEKQRLTLPTPFLTKTYQLVDDPAVNDLISWNEDGSGFIIWRPAEFARDLLPKYFKHNNLSSFVRQLNTYGFRKVVPDRWEFANGCFKRGEKGLLRDIQRRKMTPFAATSSVTNVTTATTTTLVTVAAVANPTTMQLMHISTSNSGEDQVFSSTSSPGGTVLQQVMTLNSTSPELAEENERLKKENEQMTNELSHLRGLCNNIFMLMSGYGPSGQQDPGNPSMESKQLDLLQSGRFSEEQGGSSGGNCEMEVKETEEDRSCPKLFGVSIGSKRARKSDDSESASVRRYKGQSENINNKAQSEMKLDISHPGPSEP